MNPIISDKKEKDGELSCRISNTHTSIVNGLRRTILADIPTVVFKTSPNEESDCKIYKNTSRYNNEILKQRLSCIPIHISDPSINVNNLVMKLEYVNNGTEIEYVTTEHFRIRSKTSGNYLKEEEVRKIYPMNNKTGMFIDFARLRPKIDINIKGEEIKFVADFSVQTAKKNSI